MTRPDVVRTKGHCSTCGRGRVRANSRPIVVVRVSIGMNFVCVCLECAKQIAEAAKVRT